jgi:hypothetical protein
LKRLKSNSNWLSGKNKLMANTTKHHASQIMVIIAFAIVYIVWGSTYFFIQKVVREIPPFFMGALRFGIAGILLLTWCIIKGENVWQRQQIKNAAISGAMMLFIGNGAVIWTEQNFSKFSCCSARVCSAIMVCSAG